jgi:DUF1680 family protein
MKGMGSNGPEYHQDHIPVRQATEAAGHAVRQMYLLTGVADLYIETGEQALWDATNRLWLDITRSKMFITGGVGSRYDGEAFGESYELPPDQCYCETCAAIGNLMWNWRLLLISGDGRYADLIERTLYNGILSSPAMDGRHFFYVNPLMLRNGRSMRQSTNPPEGMSVTGRPKWHVVACCPPNVMRLFSSLAHYLITTNDNGIQIHQYASAEIDLSYAANRRVAFRIETKYPWDGMVQLTVSESDGSPWQLGLRVPEWCPSARVSVNGESIKVPEIKKGYVVLNRPWRASDVVQLELSMAPVLIEANPRVNATRECLAIQRGPMVYCLESIDNTGFNLMDIQLEETAPLHISWREDLFPEGMMVVQAKGYALEGGDWQSQLYNPLGDDQGLRRTPLSLMAIPYYAWANRGLDGMRVWVPRARIF